MTIEAKLDETNKLLEKLVGLFGNVPAAKQAAQPRAAKAVDKPADPAPKTETAPVVETKPAEPDPFDDTPPAVAVAKGPPTKDEIREVLVRFQTSIGKPQTVALLNIYGAVSIGTIPPNNARALVDEAEAILATPAKGADLAARAAVALAAKK
jgi:hypothetical protein